MCGHGLGVLEGAAGFQISRDPGGSECMTADPRHDAKPAGAALDHAPSIKPVHRLIGPPAGTTGSGAERRLVRRRRRSAGTTTDAATAVLILRALAAGTTVSWRICSHRVS
jgi:hypothetical protein